VNKIFTIAHITVKREFRNKMVYILLAIAFLFVFIARGCTAGKVSIEKALVSPEQIINMGIAIAFNVILFWGLSLCGLLAMNAISRELDEETVVLTITKPIKRSWFLLGKFLGVLFIVFVNLIALSIGFILLLYFRTGMFTLSIFSGLTVSLLNFIFIISLIFLFSLFLPRVISALLALAIYITSLGLSIPFSFEKIRAYWEPSSSTQLLHYLLPKMGGLHLYAISFTSSYFPSSQGFWSAIDLLGYIIGAWLFMIFIFRRKEI
jgi:ABC-type transport system involved in multi-copper enzyme maturation permease subunit